MANLGFSVCVCLCVYMCVFHVGVHTHACVCMCTCVLCICIAVCACIFVHVCALFVAVRVYMHCACVCVHMCVGGACLCAERMCMCLCTCMHVCACMCITAVCIDMHCVYVGGACMCPLYTCVHMHVHVRVPVCALLLGAFICTVHMCVGACMYAVCACMYVHVHVHACVCSHVVHMCLCMPDQCVTSHVPRSSPQSAIECSSLLRTLHGLEQEHLRRSLALQQEEDFAKAHRQLAIFQRNELHSIFFTQIKSAIFKGELKPEAAKMLLQDYSKIQVMPQMRLSLMEESFSWTVSVNFSSFWAKSYLFCAGFQWTNAVFLRPLDAAAEFPISRANGGLKHRP